MTQPHYPQQAPPQKQGMGAGKIILIIVGVLMLGGMGSCLVCTTIVGSAANEVAEKAEEKEDAKKKEIAKCDQEPVQKWDGIAKELKENEARVAARWKGKCQKVSGVVSSIASDFQDKPKVIIKGANKAFSINSLYCKPTDEKKALDLKKGQKITVWGLGGNESIGSLWIEHCDW